MKDRIREIRKRLGLNQTEFGQKVGLSQGAITGYEKGIHAPSDAILKLICTTYNVDYNWLKYGDGLGPFIQSESLEDELDRLMFNQSRVAKIIVAAACRVLDDHAWKKFREMIRVAARQLKEEDEKKEGGE